MIRPTTLRTRKPSPTLALAAIAACAGAALPATLADAQTIPSAAQPAAPDKVLVNRTRDGLAIQGYDPVAYFTLGKPTKGDARYQSRHEGATYRFASDAHKKMFDAEPHRYVPAYGGYCGYAASINRLSPIDPEYWQILDGRLVLQHNQKALRLWNDDLQGNIVKADANWPGLLSKNGGPVKMLVNTDDKGIAIQGYDPVAYFTVGTPTKGKPEHMAVFDGATYHFMNEENRATFEREPARYAPAYGGYCGYAASINKISPIDPTIFQIIDDRLVLQHTKEAYRLFNKEPDKSLRNADTNWPGLVERRGK